MSKAKLLNQADSIQELDINLIAARFRSILDQLKSTGNLNTLYGFRDFPRGACGNTSDMFIMYMRDVYRIDAEYWIGQLDHGGTHAWVVVNNLYIDLTADQFNSSSMRYAGVIVCNPEDYPLNHLIVSKKKGVGPTDINYFKEIYGHIKNAIHNVSDEALT